MSRAAATLRGPYRPADPQRKLRAAAPAVLVVTLVLLLPCSSPVPGTTIAGARKWYTVAGLSFQPSEPAKVALALWGYRVQAP